MNLTVIEDPRQGDPHFVLREARRAEELTEAVGKLPAVEFSKDAEEDLSPSLGGPHSVETSCVLQLFLGLGRHLLDLRIRHEVYQAKHANAQLPQPPAIHQPENNRIDSTNTF